MEASVAFSAVGAAATGVAWYQNRPTAIWLALGYFTLMEMLQVAGYGVLNQCGTTSNRSITMLSYLHIAFQPLVINAFALELVPGPVRDRVRGWVLALSAGSAAVMVAQLLPWPAVGSCTPGAPLCADQLCTVSGSWHIAWDVPYNGLMVPFEQAIGVQSGFPTYMATVFLLPLVYGAWRFVLLHVFAGPVLAWGMTSNPNEMPAVWCLFSIAILLISLSPVVRRSVSATTWWGVRV